MRAALLIVLGALMLSGCAAPAPTPAAIGDRLDMGPFTFSVVSATQGKQWQLAEGAAGNSIGTSPSAVAPVHTAGRDRSEHYTCLFRYSRSSDGVRDFDTIGTRLRDFKLMITNPAPEGQQPRRVAIQL